MSDVDLSWMNVVGEDGLTWIQRNSGSPVDLSWMNVPGPDGLTWIQRNSITGVAAPSGPGSPAQQGTTEDQNALAYISKLLDDMNLGVLKDRVWDYIVKNGAKDENRLFLWMTDQPEFEARFPAYKELQKDVKRAITPGQYMALERSYKQIMQDAGIPPEFFDMQPGDNDFTDLIRNEVSPEEFQKRVQDGYERVAKADVSVRNAFRDYFGIDGDAALAAFFIDPSKSRPALIQAAKAAELGAVGRSMFMDVGLNYASKLASMGISKEQAISGFEKMASVKDLFTQGVGEVSIQSVDQNMPNYVEDLQGTREIGIPESNVSLGNNQGISTTSIKSSEESSLGMDYIFGTNLNTKRELELRLKQRKAQASGVTQQNLSDKQGRTGVGQADQ